MDSHAVVDGCHPLMLTWGHEIRYVDVVVMNISSTLGLRVIPKLSHKSIRRVHCIQVLLLAVIILLLSL